MCALSVLSVKKEFEKDEQLIGFSVHQLGIPEMEKAVRRKVIMVSNVTLTISP